MTSEEKFDIILNKLTNLEDGQKSLIKRQSSLEEGQNTLIKKQESLKEGQNRLIEEFLNFKDETEKNFGNTNELLNQAFQKITENLSYQDKVIEIEKIIRSRAKNYA